VTYSFQLTNSELSFDTGTELAFKMVGATSDTPSVAAGAIGGLSEAPADFTVPTLVSIPRSNDAVAPSPITSGGGGGGGCLLK
jgi:hypothetical protein